MATLFAGSDFATTKPDKFILTESNGEILFPSVELLLSKMQLTAEDHFVDLGAGHGKVILQVLLQTMTRTITGIEIVASAYARAKHALQRLQVAQPHLFSKRNLQLIHGDFFSVQLKPQPTVVWLNATCFSQSMLHKLALLLNCYTELRMIISLRPLLHLERCKFVKRFSVECSWDTALCYVYERQ